MNRTAYFFQGDLLLLPADFPDSRFDSEIPLEFAEDFDNPDIFEVPALDSSLIQVVSVMPETELPKGWRGIPVRQVLTMLSLSALSADRLSGSHLPGNHEQTDSRACRIIRACHIAQWRSESRFCGRCSAQMHTPSSGADEQPPLHRICPNCGRMEFPRICPAVIVLITDDENRILLAHNKKFRAGLYSLIAGFSEAGESLEATVAREVREETNIEIQDITYVKSQPWPFPNSLMLGFKARYLSGTLKPDGIEIEDVQWRTKENMPEIPAEGSLSRFLINHWLNGTRFAVSAQNKAKTHTTQRTP